MSNNRFPYLVLLLVLVLGLFTPSAHAQDCDSNGLSDILELGPFLGAGGSRLFDDPGAGQRLRTIGNGPDLALQDFSIEMWIYRNAATGGREYWVSMGQIGMPNQNLHIGFPANQTLRFAFTGTTLDSAAAFPPDGQWHHWALTYRRAGGIQMIYRDGIPIAQGLGTVFNGTGDLRIGGFNLNDASVHGAIDELRIWNHELTQSEIVSRMNTPDLIPGNHPSLLAYYKFDEADSNDPAQDSSLSGAFDLFPESTIPGNNPAALIYDPDCNANGVIDPCDIISGFSNDCNNNGIPDECDIANGASQDCNNNGIPDECETDCNNNGIPDDCDIDNGTSQDCNLNGIPDECDFASGTSQDCNNNGIPDECDIANGTSQDCNNNGIPDECDIASGTSQDCNLNGIPDECETDCNGNGIPDECDIFDSTSLDENTNGVPDECEDILNITRGTYWSTIQLAIDNVAANDTIELQPGTYAGFAKADDQPNCTLQSIDPEDPAVVLSTSVSNIIAISSITLSGLNLSSYSIRADSGLFAIDRCRFESTNGLSLVSFLSYLHTGVSVTISNTSFIGCTGDAIHVSDASTTGGLNLLISNCRFINNAGSGIGYYKRTGDFIEFCALGCEVVARYHDIITLENNLFVGNQGSGFFQRSQFMVDSINRTPTTTIRNNIFLDSPALDIGASGNYPYPLDIDHNLINGGYPGYPDNIDADPLFVDPDGPDNDPATVDDNDYHLSAASPCIDGGEAGVVAPPATDLDSLPRIVNGIIDMGPYEYQGPPPCPADLTGDGELDFFDVGDFLEAFAAQDPIADFTGDGMFNFFDVGDFLEAYAAGCP